MKGKLCQLDVYIYNSHICPICSSPKHGRLCTAHEKKDKRSIHGNLCIMMHCIVVTHCTLNQHTEEPYLDLRKLIVFYISLCQPQLKLATSKSIS